MDNPKEGTSECPPKASPTPNSTRSTTTKQKKPLPLPPNWVKVMSDKGPYYWNKELNKTQWKFPREEAVEFLHLQKSHGYINLPPGSSVTSADSASPRQRSRNSQRSSKTLSNKKSASPLTKRKSSTLPNNKDTNGLKSSSVLKGELDSRPRPPDGEDTPTNLPLLTSGDPSGDCDSPPPPIPARNYTEKDVKELNGTGTDNIYPEGPGDVPHEGGDSPPPPIPTRTELSTQLVTPPTKSNLTSSHFIYNSNISDINIMGNNNTSDDTNKPPLRPPITSQGSVGGKPAALIYDEIPEPSKTTRNTEQTKEDTSNNTDTVTAAVYDEVPGDVIMRNPARLPNQRSLDDHLIDNRPPLPDPVSSSVSSTLIYDEVFDPQLKTASRHHHKPLSVVVTGSTQGSMEYNKLSFGQSNMAAVNLTSPVEGVKPPIGVYDKVFEHNKRPSSSVDDNSSMVVYDEVPTDLSHRMVSKDTPTGDTPTSTPPPVYNELDLSATSRPVSEVIKKQHKGAQSLPRNARLGMGEETRLRHGLAANPPPTQSPPPPPGSGGATPPSPGGRRPPTLPPTRTPPSDRKIIKTQSLNPKKKTPPPSQATPPLPTSRDVTPVPPIAAYEVVPINPPMQPQAPVTNTNKPPLSSKPHPPDEIFMTVNHEAQLQRFQRFGGSLRSTNTPQNHPKRSATYDRTKVNKSSSNPALDNEMYDHLNHGKVAAGATASTLPRVTNVKTADSTYSTLQREDEPRTLGVKVQQHESVTLSQDSIVELIHAPSVPSPDVRRREHLYEEFKEDGPPPPLMRRHSNPTILGDQPVPMIYAPDHPSTDVFKRKQHIYEVCDKESDQSSNGTDTPPEHMTSSPQLIRKPHLKNGGMTMPTLVWDDDLNQDSKGFKKGGVIPQPSSVSDKDYERRLMKLENHYYGAIDIPEWPGQQPTLVTSPSDIKQVVKESWLTTNKENGEDLPPGWTKELNEQGQEFYWHIPTGKLQYVKPTAGSHLRNSKSCSPGDSDTASGPTPSSTTDSTFAAEYWGSCTVTEDSLIKGKSVQVVLTCIKKILEENAPFTLYGGLKQQSQIHIKVTDTELQWLSADTNAVLISQPINRIRVWGVGRENEREFGYIARNMATKKHVCHVFLCDIAAIGIAQAMLNSHNGTSSSRRPSIDRELSAGDIGNNESMGGTVLVQVPFTAAPRGRSVTNAGQQDSNMINPSNTNPSTAADEHEEDDNSQTNAESYKRLEATYIGFTDVEGAHGIDVLNEAVAQLSIAKSRWLPVYVDIATSHIKILDKKNEQLLKEHRVRFLSFLGIATDDRYCGYVVDNGDNQFLFHGFQCQPNADRLCLALHAACQARYQRVIDAHLNDGELGNIDSSIRQKRSLLLRIGSWKSKNREPVDEDSKPSSLGFIVQFLGYELVPKPKGVDSIKEPLRKVATKTSGIHLIELVVTPTGFTINDPQKKYFASKNIHSKKICYCAKVRSYFVFIAQEGSKYYCYMFTESDVPLASITDAINQIMH